MGILLLAELLGKVSEYYPLNTKSKEDHSFSLALVPPGTQSDGILREKKVAIAVIARAERGRANTNDNNNVWSLEQLFHGPPTSGQDGRCREPSPLVSWCHSSRQR
jgi:hypothetical protein